MNKFNISNFVGDFDVWRRKVNRIYKLQFNHKFVGCSGLLHRLGDRLFCIFVRAFNRAVACRNSKLNLDGRQVFSVGCNKITINIY